MDVVALTVLRVQAVWVDKLLQAESLPVVLHWAEVYLVRRQHHGVAAVWI